MLTITLSNRFESLLAALLDTMSEPPDSPFAAEQIVIPSAAMRRKIELSIADNLGICAHTSFSFLRSWVTQQNAAAQEETAFAPEFLAWRVYRIFCDDDFVSQYPRLDSWFKKADAVMRYELAQMVATLLEQYMLYRPHWMNAWLDAPPICPPQVEGTAEQDRAWQIALWQRIVREHGTCLPWPGALAARPSGTAHVFCPPTIAPLHIEMLQCFAQTMDIHLYLLNPCREYWFDIVDPRQLGYLKAKGQADYHDSGNRLLSSWGKQTQAMLGRMFADNLLVSHEQSEFAANRENGDDISLLAQLQDAILEMNDPEPGSIILQDADRSIEIHVCHSLGRELEVLQDQLLALFASDIPPRPDDVLVVTPDIEQAAPLIDAIFGTAQAARRIPYTIAGRKRRQENIVAGALLDLLSVASSRFAASAVFGLLQQAVIARRFGIDDGDLSAIHKWIAASGIRWGLSAKHRSQLGLPDQARYSFEDGLHRLFLGYTLPSGIETPFGQRLAASYPEGSTAAALGSFWQFMQQMLALQSRLPEPKSPDDWKQMLLTLTGDFMFPVGNELDDWREVRQQIFLLCDQIRSGGEDLLIPPEVLLAALAKMLDDTSSASVPTGAVTFASMSGLRNLPYRIICVIGMNDGSFPTSKRPSEFDLMAIRPEPGDRQRRTDERNLFLDLLLAARERVYLSYTGKSVRDNSPMPPSVLVADLLDYLTEAMHADPQTVRQRLVVEHPLQPFSFASFQHGADRRILSSHGEYRDALEAKLRHPVVPTIIASDTDDESEIAPAEATMPFFNPSLATPEGEWHDVTLEQLLRFFRNPCRFLLQQRLGIIFPESPEELLDDEPFLPAWDEKNALGDRLLPLYLADASEESIRASAFAGSEFPPGKLGSQLLEKELLAMDKFAQSWRQLISQQPLPPFSATLAFTIEGEAWKLTGTLGDLRPDGLFRCRFDDTRATDYLAGWLHHLFLNAAAPQGVKHETVWHSRNGHYRLAPVSDAHAHLQQLLELYRKGLSKPLHFFPRSAWEYMATQQNMEKARGKWRRWDGAVGEGLDAAYRQALRGIDDPLDEEFVACARTVFQPLLSYINDDRLELGGHDDTEE